MSGVLATVSVMDTKRDHQFRMVRKRIHGSYGYTKACAFCEKGPDEAGAHCEAREKANTRLQQRIATR